LGTVIFMYMLKLSVIPEPYVIPDDITSKARKISDELGGLNHSILKGKGNEAGMVGELMACKYLGLIYSPTYNYDVVTSSNITIDVKTKRTTMNFVKINFDASIPAYNTKQKCQVYLFTRYNTFENIHNLCWLIGWIPKKEYFDKARFMKKGTLDPSNNWTVKADCYNLSYNNLYKFPIDEDYVLYYDSF